MQHRFDHSESTKSLVIILKLFFGYFDVKEIQISLDLS